MQALLFFYHSVITGLPLTLCLERSLWLVNRMSGLTLVKTTSLIYCQSLFSICRLQPQYGSLYQGRRQCSVSPPFFHLNHHINHSHHLLAPSVVTYCFLSCRFWGSRRKKVKWGIWRDLTWSCTIISWLCALWVQCFLSWALRDPCVPFTPADEPLISFLGDHEDLDSFFRSGHPAFFGWVLFVPENLGIAPQITPRLNLLSWLPLRQHLSSHSRSPLILTEGSYQTYILLLHSLYVVGVMPRPLSV